MIRFFARLNAVAQYVPHELLAALARLSIGTVFLRSGLLKLEGWADGTTLALFREEYRLPLLPPEVAAWLATAAELSLPILLFFGLFTRLAALGLLTMTLVIQLFVYPNAFDTHGTWAVVLLYLVKFGPGTVALDSLFARPPAARKVTTSPTV